ncbi:MAG: protease [Deltaproteobacteria bacterium RIFCSPLOWO2_02_FULL_44_10]|nr:MAG: protease [Deltaproteobacteria bacterium RIFCSPHIGHO2_02_FULL_44_16]OGQ45732.1 MAG: protease [Deltaproteobacteria bacterium RIFCSPLOWO2_02_FULL_44_10]
MTLHKKIALLLENYFEDVEVLYPYYRLQEEGHEVLLIGPKSKTEYKGKYGYPLISHKGIDEVANKDFDGVMIPGGYAPDHIRRTPAMIDFVRSMNDAGKMIAGICHAGWVMISAECVKGKKVTSFSAIKDDMVNAGGLWIDQEVVRDTNIITSRKPADLPAFCRTIISALKEQ